MPQAPAEERSALARAGAVALKVAGFFLVLEPVWMLLPFAGFFYGSVMRIETLARNPATAWLTHFVFPVLTLGWLGPALVGTGFAVFLVGAGQIYWAKFRRTGLVTNGLYRFVRHPQYIALTLFGLGILLTWGRAITFLAFFVMMFLYYYLAKSEQRSCLRLFGQAYEEYRERTSFLIPGDRLLRSWWARLPRISLPVPLRVAAAFVATLAVCLALMWLIDSVKTAGRVVPYLTATVPLGGSSSPGRLPDPGILSDTAAGVPFVQAGRVAVVRGPYRNAAPSGFAERVLLRLGKSEELKSFLAFLNEPEGDVAIVFCAPFEQTDQAGSPGRGLGGGQTERRGPPADPAGPDRVRLIIMRCSLAPGASLRDAFTEKTKRQIRSACIAPVDLGRAEGEDMVVGQILRPGPGFPGEERWSFLMQQMSASSPGTPRPAPDVVVPGQAASADLLLVRAPILRTRLDPAFAQEILDRLVASASFRHRLQAAGAGGDIVAVAFPRPGPNWYREHHGLPQISVFVMLARAHAGAAGDELFRSGGHELLGAFTAEMDFKMARSEDCVGEIAVIGPRRNLEERWKFFLSGVGRGSS